METLVATQNELICPRCGTDDVRKIGKILTQRGKVQRWICIKGHTFFALEDYTEGYKERLLKK